MNDSTQYSYEKDIKTLDRNHPIALVVGAAGFIGSHLVDHLLKLKIQVIAVDDLSSGNTGNIRHNLDDKNFVFVNEKIENEGVLNVLTHLPRLDYGFFVADSKFDKKLFSLGLVNFIGVVEGVSLANSGVKDRTKVLFLSSVNFYDKEQSMTNKFLASGEILFAKLVRENKLNGRIVRIDEVFGPRMSFSENGVLTRLIKAKVLDNLEGENPVQTFSTRGIFIDDAITLISKSVFLGATTNKIYDGEQLNPIKVDEVKQVLLDPKWHIRQNFEFAKLPPWETPNLSKSVKELSWNPKASFLDSIVKTLDYFKLHPYEEKEKNQVFEEDDEEVQQKVELKEKVEEQPVKEVTVKAIDSEEVKSEGSWNNLRKPKKVEGWSFKEIEEKKKAVKKEMDLLPIFNFIVIWIIVLVGIVYPFFVLAGGKIIIPNSLNKSEAEISKGQFEYAKQELDLGYLSAKEQLNVVSAFSSLANFGIFNHPLQEWNNVANQNVLAFQDVGQSIMLLEKFISGIEQGNFSSNWQQYNDLQIENQANLANLLAKMSAYNYSYLGNVEKSSIQDFYNIGTNVGTAGVIIPELFPSNASKKYIILLEDNNTLRPTGGILIGLALITSKDGKIVSVDPLSFDQLDSKLSKNLTPEDLIKTNLKISSLKLSNSNFDSDYQTFAKTFETLYSQAGGGGVDGVFTMDESAASSFFSEIGTVTLESGQKIVDNKSLLEILNGSDDSKRGQVLKQLLTKIFSINRINLFGVARSMGENLDKKHIQLAVNDPELFTILSGNNWSGSLISPQNQQGQINDLVSFNLYDFNNKSRIKQVIRDTINIDAQGVIKHNLTNQFSMDKSNGFDGEIFVYLPVGVKLNKILLGTDDITSQANQFVKYGLSGIAMSLSIGAGESKPITLEYQLANNLSLGQGPINYHYKFVKQAGTDGNTLETILTFPNSMKGINAFDDGSVVKSGIKKDFILDHDHDFGVQF